MSHGFPRRIALAVAMLGIGVLVYALNSQQASENERNSVARSVETCRRGNPGRAYLRLRAKEFTRTTAHRQSYTSAVSPVVFAVLNCQATVANEGKPVALSPGVEREYLKVFHHRRVPITRGDRIVGTVPFAVYFSQNAP